MDELQKYADAEKQRADGLENELLVVKSDRDIKSQISLSVIATCIKIIQLGKDKTLEDAKNIIHDDFKQLIKSCYMANHPMEEVVKGLI